MKVLMTVTEVAAYLRKSEWWVYSHQAELGATRVGGFLFFTQEVVDALLRQGEETVADGS